MSDREFWDQVPARLAEHARWQEREADRLTTELWNDVFGILGGIKIPFRPGGRPCKYPWNSMSVGDSFLTTCPVSGLQRLVNTLDSCRQNAQRKNGHRYTLRRVSKGVRIWRIK